MEEDISIVEKTNLPSDTVTIEEGKGFTEEMTEETTLQEVQEVQEVQEQEKIEEEL